MTPELARRILDLHNTTEMTQQEIAFKLGVNQGRVNEVIKRGKWLTDKPKSGEPAAREGAGRRNNLLRRERRVWRAAEKGPRRRVARDQVQLSLTDL